MEPRSDRQPCHVGVRHRHVSSQGRAQDLTDACQIIDRHRVLQRAGHISTCLERLAGSIVNRMTPCFAERSEPGPQECTEQMVITVPSSLVVEGHDEEIGRDQPLEENGRIVASADLCAQLGVEGLEHRRVDEEIDEVRRQVIQHLAQQEITDRSIGASKGVEEPTSIGASLQRKSGQLCTGRPAFRQIMKYLELVRLERQPL